MTTTTAPTARDFAAEFIAARRNVNAPGLTFDERCDAINTGMDIADAARQAGVVLNETTLAAQARVARTVVGLNVLDEQVAGHGKNLPAWGAPNAEHLRWAATRDQLLLDIAVIVNEHRDLLCRKCDGHGRFIAYTHRHGGTCYQCKGDGWTAKGRRQHAAVSL